MKKLLILLLPLVFIQTITYAQPIVNIRMDNSSFLRYEIVSFKVNLTDSGNPISSGNVTARFFYNSNLVRTVGNMNSISLYYNSSDSLWYGYWPTPWNPPIGIYIVNVTANVSGSTYYNTSTFIIAMRQPKEILPEGYLSITAEDGGDLTTFSFPGPYGEANSWTNMYEWAKFMGADSIWPSAGAIEGYYYADANDSYPWYKPNYRNFSIICQKANESGLSCDMVVWPFTVSEPENAKNWYNITFIWSLIYDCNTGNVVNATSQQYASISILDGKIFNDIMEMINLLLSNQYVNGIGFDWEPGWTEDLRLANDEFVRKMNVSVPNEWWTSYTQEDKMKWVGKRIGWDGSYCSNDQTVWDKWYRWMVYNYAKTLKRIIDESNTSKSFFLYAGLWQPWGALSGPNLMYNDAGIDIIAPMTYTSPAQAKRPFNPSWPNGCWFEGGLNGFKSTVNSSQLPNVVSGQIVWYDAYKNCTYGKDMWYPFPQEMYDRFIMTGEMYNDSRIAGLFFHDILRANGNIIGDWHNINMPYQNIEWTVAGGAAASELRLEAGRIPINMSIDAPNEINYGDRINGNIIVKNIGSSCLDVNVFLINNTTGWNFISAPNTIVHLCSGNTATIPFTVESNTRNYDTDNRFMIAAKSTWSSNKTDTHLEFKYVHAVPKSMIYGRLKDKDGNAVDSKITLYQNNNLISSNITDSQGNYYMFVPSGTYDVQFNLSNFYITNYSIRLKDVDMTYDVSNPINYITSNISGNQVSIILDMNKTQTFYINSDAKPTRIFKNNSILSSASSLSNLSINEWFYNESEQKTYLIIDRFLKGFEPIFGKMDIGESGTGWPGYLYTTGPYDVNTTANVTSIYVYTPKNGTARVALYDSIYNPSQYFTHYNPHNLLVQSGEEYCLSSAWHAFSIPLTQIQPGKYFIVLKMGSEGMLSETPRDGFGQFNNDEYSLPFPNPFSIVSATGAEFSAYACCS